MSFIEQAIHEKLSATTAITDIVGTNIFLGTIPQGTTLPAICFYQHGGGPVYRMEGESNLEMKVFRFDLLVDKYEEVELITLHDALQTAIGGFRGTMGTVYAMNVQRCMLVNVRDSFEPDSEARERFLEFEIDYITA